MANDRKEPNIYTAAERKALLLELAARPDGASVSEVYERALALGDKVTEEAYYNLARRLVHRGLLVANASGRSARYTIGASAESRWIEEDDLNALVDPEYPLLAITIWKESRRQINEVPEELWVELRNRLRGQSARELFKKAILSYSEDFHAQVATLVEEEKDPTPELPRLRREAENSRQLLFRLTKFGLGLSREAIDVPLNLATAISGVKDDAVRSYVNEAILEKELARRIAPESFVVDVEENSRDRNLLIGAVDGSTRGGMLSFLGEAGDIGIGHAPMISINTSIGQVNRSLDMGERTVPMFMRLPEKPEDMQRQDNRYTVMAKLLYPDLSDAEYMHAVWNAMDVIESRVALRLLKRWYGPKPGVEIAPADIVLRDGTVSPQDRDFSHYQDLSTYGQIVRDMIQIDWEIAASCRDNGQTVAGVVKEAQLTVFAPILNWYACQVAGEKTGQLQSWPIQTMNLIPDQMILTRLLTAGREKGAPWIRTCVVLRPFHAVTNYVRSYSRDSSASRPVLDSYKEAVASPDKLSQEKKVFWETIFRPESDPYTKMMDHVFYASFFLGAVPRLDIDKKLPRLEVLVPTATSEDGGETWPQAQPHVNRLIDALRQNGFQVSAEHSMFQNDAQLDVLPGLIIRAHDTVKHWAAELLSRVQEYIGYYLARYVKSKRFRGIKVRPFTRDELELLYSQLKRERELQAGGPGSSERLSDK